ncbi:HAD family hydrolase [Mucilaginibacter auburnensis]|uniref:phosphoglycolate phosphatase n=1 Tax=Mucilaginibacter auburnensis TaxID=1457233 RepID=A0A2H9VMQ9_9SPHI|nr:HAD family hydrolase [Mucilaginibacter auburnensis]PJJ79619.1 phosphoglycolate phosphatase [Mucilaginibacter auburnensis]
MNTSLKNIYDSIIFDLDGTLWDSTGVVAEAWQAAKNEVDFINEDITADMVKGITGMTYKAIFEKLFPYLTDEKREEYKAIAAKYELEVLHTKGGQLYPRLEETLQYLVQKYKLFIVSNCQSGYIEVFFKTSGLKKYFQGHQCYGTKNAPKAENIKDIVNDHGLKAPVYVGDTMGDYNAAVGAGVPFIFAAYGFGKVEEGQVATLTQVSDLTELV